MKTAPHLAYDEHALYRGFSFETLLTVLAIALVLLGLLLTALALTHVFEEQVAGVRRANRARAQLARQLHRSNAFYCGASCCVKPSFRLGERVVGLSQQDLDRLRGSR